ncbi:hypothetical protein EYZ11_011862 [Aspergillus tanneri]|uniref:Uncharacterized protein n=1 Tax=Aspergillus tanneri TaxID=1220188 RepID=A0A4S3J1P8_9EURO|nr:uncharacterized protein ATNIH1004_008038 [Aspergillus tanneri]KAA8646605.1 hypothetical protein ATNIH1004_008038 [Aspergillus tanneri]THC88693.1 hypothetical protein EYZ11_011862 [Aspergillus tanneri]
MPPSPFRQTRPPDSPPRVGWVQLLGAFSDPTGRSPESTTANVVPPNTPLLPRKETEGHVKEPIGLMVPSPDDPSAYAERAANISKSGFVDVVGFQQPADAQDEVAPKNSPTTISAPDMMDQLKELFQAAPEQKSGSTAHSNSHPSKPVIADIMPANTLLASNLGNVAIGDAREPVGLIAPSSIDPSAYADCTSAAANHHLPDIAQTKPIPGSAPSETVTMGHLKELFVALLERRSQLPAPSVLALRMQLLSRQLRGLEPEANES